MIILVCGSRSCVAREYVYKTLLDIDWAFIGSNVHPEALRIVHGGANGADTLAGDFGHKYGHEVVVYPADWAKYGSSAGIMRNVQMLEEEKPDVVVAFWDGWSNGTKHTVYAAIDRGIPVYIYSGWAQ